MDRQAPDPDPGGNGDDFVVLENAYQKALREVTT
jgi:hypothetical protein